MPAADIAKLKALATSDDISFDDAVILVDGISMLIARIEELEQERDDARAHENMARATYDPMATCRAEAAEKRVAELEAALRPFVKEFNERREAYIRRYPRNPGVGANNFDAMPDSWNMENSTFAMGDFRRARNALGA